MRLRDEHFFAILSKLLYLVNRFAPVDSIAKANIDGLAKKNTISANQVTAWGEISPAFVPQLSVCVRG